MEYFDLVDSDGQPLGLTKPRPHVHRDGDWHRAIDIWVLNSQGQLLLQKRSLEKESYPGLWEVSCSGHISAGDESLSSALRELEEELGITADPQDLSLIFTLRESHNTNNNTFINNEFKDVYLIKADLKIDELQLQTEEVSAVRWISIEDLKLHHSDADFVPHPEEYAKLFLYLSRSAAYANN